MPTTNPLPTGQLREQIPALSIDELRRLGTLLATQGQALELIARGADLNAILEALCLLIERESPDSICSILLMRDGCLRLGPGPNLPPEYAQGLDGLALGEAKGSCGTAAFRREPVIVTDIASSPLWVEFRDFALCHGIAACWSIPIFDRHDRVVGTFAISHQEPRKPTRYQLELLHTAGHLASIAIDRQHADDERQRLEHSLMHRQKLESLGLMAGGIAHDFNNLLTAIVGNLSLLENEPSLSRKGRRRVELAMTAATSATALTTQMLTYAGLASVEIGELDLAAEIRAAVDPLRATLRPGVTISLDLGTEIGLRGDVGQIRQLISNLVLNGVDALGDADGEIAVSVSTQELTASAPKVDHAGDPIPSGRYVVLDVRDPGHGIDPSQIHQIFDPFYSSKRSGRGLGLAMVLGGARAHDAPLCIASRLGAGTTISVFFPESRWVSRPTVEPSAASVAPAAIDAAESVPVLLLVEDQETVRLLVSEILEDLGWRVHRAVDGLDGWRRWQELPQVDAVFLDRCMPGLSGDEVLRRIRAEDTEVPIIVSSGFGETALAELVPKGASGVLPKPFSVTQLLTLMRSLGLSVDDDA